jgi:hypothetical protein
MLLTVFILLALLITFSSQLAVLYLRSYLADYNSDIAIQSLRINWFRSQLSLEGFSARGEAGEVIVVDELHVEWDPAALWEKHLRISSLQISGLNLTIESDNWRLDKVGPIPLPASQPAQQANPSEWKLSITDIGLSNHAICIDDSSLDTTDLGLPLYEQLPVNICLNIGDLSLPGSIEMFSDTGIVISTALELVDFSVNHDTVSELVSLKSLSASDFRSNQSEIILAGIQINKLSALAVDDEFPTDMGITLDAIEIETVSHRLNKQSTDITKLLATDASVQFRGSDDKLHELLGVNSIRTKHIKAQPQNTAINDLTVTDLVLLENFLSTNQELTHIASLAQGSVPFIELTPRRLKTASINLEQVVVDLTLTKEGTELANWFKAQEVRDSITGDEAQSAAFEIMIDGLTLSKASAVKLTDLNLPAPKTISKSDIQLIVGVIDTSRVDTQPTAISFSMNSGESGVISGSGSLLLNKTIAADLTGTVKHLDLTHYSEYLARYIGYRVNQGNLNLDYKLTLADNKLKMDIETRFEKFRLGNLQEHEQHELNEDLGLPLPLALNLLRDSDDNISLSLTVDGSLDDPKFSVSRVVSVVVAKAIKNAVIFHYSPLGMLSLASGVIDLASALTFEPVDFEPQVTSLSDEAEKQLQKIQQLLIERPKVTIVVCAVATQMDLQGQDGESNSEDSLQQLLQLAKTRQANVINYLLSDAAISKERLLGCNIQLAAKPTAKPVVKLSI